MRCPSLFAAAAIGGLLNAPANACSFNAPPDYRISRANAETVVLGSVVKAAYTGAHKRDLRPWTGVVKAKRVLRGATDTQSFSIGRSGSTAACDDGIPPPAIGATWVLYIGKRHGKEVVLLAYPLSVASTADPSLTIGDEGN